MTLNEEFQIHDHLNEKVWDTSGHLLPQVREKIVEIVKQFEQDLQAPIYIADIQVVGSNASFDYTDTSDLDVHIIANYELVSSQVELVQLIYDLSKTQFNKDYDISIYGINVELYVQDVNSACVSNGIYSVLDNKWIKEPKPLKSASKKNIDQELAAWRSHIVTLLQNRNKQDIIDAINTLYLIRHNAIAEEGQFSKGNQLFKEIRSLGLLDKLKDTLSELTQQELTLENYKKSCSNGELINILKD